ncbi:MAG: hypothetical protein AB8A66_07295, partial [Prochlorococcus sp.]
KIQSLIFLIKPVDNKISYYYLPSASGMPHAQSLASKPPTFNYQTSAQHRANTIQLQGSYEIQISANKEYNDLKQIYHDSSLTTNHGCTCLLWLDFSQPCF